MEPRLEHLLEELYATCARGSTGRGARKQRTWSGGQPLVTGGGGIIPLLAQNFDCDEGAGSQYTVQFKVIPPAGAGLGYYAAEAHVNWFCQGTSIERKLDVLNGASITGTGDGCEVKVYDRTTFPGGIGIAPGAQYTVLATLAPGTRGAQHTPPTLHGVVTESTSGNAGLSGALTLPAAGNFDVYLVPTNSGVTTVEIVVMSPTPLTSPVGQCEVSHETQGIVMKQYDPTVNIGFIALGNGANAVEVINYGGLSLVYALTWGIDG